jgi:prohibitin 1
LSDLQTVNIKLRVLFRPRADRLPQLYRDLGVEYAERVLPSIVNETLKAVVVLFYSLYVPTCAVRSFHI